MKKCLVSIWGKTSNHLTRYVRYYVIALLLLAVLLSIIMPLTNRRLEPLEQIGISQLVCSILTLVVIFYTLYFILRQLRIAEARPKLSLAFYETGETEATISVVRGTGQAHELELWMSNCGDAVAKEFQVDLNSKRLFGLNFCAPLPKGTLLYDSSEAATGIRTISFSNLSLPCFVNRPLRVAKLILYTTADSHDLYPQDFTITCRIYGTWGREQGGVLKVRLNKNPST